MLFLSHSIRDNNNPMSDQIDSMTGFIKNFENKAGISLLGLAIDRRGESGFNFYRIDCKLGEALGGRLQEDFRCSGLSSQPGGLESGRGLASLSRRKQGNRG